MDNLFVYGSLLFPEIRDRLVGKKVEIIDAKLNGFKRVCVLGEDYPALTRKKGHTVQGELLLDIDDPTMKLLTLFEGDEYDLKHVTAELSDKQVLAHAFLWKTGLEYTLDSEWGLKNFRKESLAHYINIIVPEIIQFYRETDFELF